MSSLPSVWTVPDTDQTSDPFFDDYKKGGFARSNTPIIIDNGSYQCRVGWATENEPRLLFPPVMTRAKLRKEDRDSSIIVGSEIKGGDLARPNCRTPHERGIVYAKDVQELILDHAFSHLGIDADRIHHPILITEPVCNPNYSRRLMSELLFECYNVPSVCYGIDSLLSYQWNQAKLGLSPASSGVVVSSGFETSHVLPVVNSRLVPSNANRVNVGALQSINFLTSFIQTTHPVVRLQFNPTRVKSVIDAHCHVVEDYIGELRRLEIDHTYSQSQTVTVQLPFNPTQVGPSAAELEQKAVARKELGKKLSELSKRKRADKGEELSQQLQSLEELKGLFGVLEEEFEAGLDEWGLESVEDLDVMIANVQAEINKTLGRKEEPTEEAVDLTEPEAPALLSVPDDQLSPEELKEKKKAVFLYNTSLGRWRLKLKREENKVKMDRERSEMRARFEADPDTFLKELRERRFAVMGARDRRIAAASQTVGRRSVAAQKKMRLLAKTMIGEKEEPSSKSGRASARSKQPPAEDDNFGQKDEDWDIYRAVQDDAGEESDEEKAQLAEIESILAEFDPTFVQAVPQEKAGPVKLTPEDFQVSLCVERIRVPEIVFEPSIVGVDQAGLGECLGRVINRFDPGEQSQLANNVFVCGGNTAYQGFTNRVLAELRALRPFNSTIRVWSAQDAYLDAWRGGALFARGSGFASSSLTKKLYEEVGYDYLVEHAASNVYVPTPASDMEL